MDSWYLSWFGEEYLKTYGHRDDLEAEAQLSFILNELIPAIRTRVLDVACGRGRHVLSLAKRELLVTGIDYSWPALLRGQEQLNLAPNANAQFIRADMRHIPFRAESFSLVLSMFTSFGYFNSDTQHRDLLKEWALALSVGGDFVLDYLNRDYVIANLTPFSREEHPERSILQHRRLSADQLRVEKKIEIVEKNTNELKTFHESVRMFTTAEVLELIDSAGLTVTQTFGDFAGAGLTTSSPRSIFFARKDSRVVT